MEQKRNTESAGVFVYRVYSTFTHPGMKGFFVDDEESEYAETIFCDIEVLARDLIGCRDRLRYDGNMTKYDTYVDGYFGRPLIPAESLLLRRLRKKEIGDLERALNKAEREERRAAKNRMERAFRRV